jgi:uncharacterized membrane-anchored protein
MFGIAAVVAFAVGLILWLAGGGSHALWWLTFTLVGALCVALHLLGVWPWRRTPS